MAKGFAVVNPNMGLYFDRAKIALGSRMLQDGKNFRVKEGKLENLNLGYDRFETFTLNGQVGLIYDFLFRDGTDKLIFGTPTDLYQYSPSGHSVSYITPRYETGTASTSGTAVTGIGTAWNTSVGNPGRKNALPGDEISFGATGRTDPAAIWFTVLTVNSDTSITLTASAGVIVAGAYTLRQKFQGKVTDIWVAETFWFAAPQNEDQFFTTNGVDQVVRWNGSATQVTRSEEHTSELHSQFHLVCRLL